MASQLEQPLQSPKVVVVVVWSCFSGTGQKSLEISILERATRTHAHIRTRTQRRTHTH